MIVGVVVSLFLGSIRTAIVPLVAMPVSLVGAMICLLYTSDAADERSSVDLGGRRIIKKKNIMKSVISTELHTKAQLILHTMTESI